MQVRTDYLRLYRKAYSHKFKVIDECIDVVKKLAVVIGLGEVGKPIYKLLNDSYGEKEIYGRDIDEPNWAHSQLPKPTFEFMHICIPQTPKFFGIVKSYVAQYEPVQVIVHSTLHPGSIKKINSQVYRGDPTFYYSPVRGNLRDGMEWGLKTYTKFVAPMFNYIGVHNDSRVVDHLEGAQMPTKLVRSPESLEYSKIFNLAYYGTSIAIFQEFERIIEAKNLNYDEIKDFIFSTETDSAGLVPRPRYYGGHIGGHCIIPALEKIIAAHDVDLFKAVIESNVKRERELTLK